MFYWEVWLGSQCYSSSLFQVDHSVTLRLALTCWWLALTSIGSVSRKCSSLCQYMPSNSFAFWWPRLLLGFWQVGIMESGRAANHRLHHKLYAEICHLIRISHHTMCNFWAMNEAGSHDLDLIFATLNPNRFGKILESSRCTWRKSVIGSLMHFDVLVVTLLCFWPSKKIKKQYRSIILIDLWQNSNSFRCTLDTSSFLIDVLWIIYLGSSMHFG